MKPYHHLFRQEKNGVFHQMRQKGLISVTVGWYSNFWMTLVLPKGWNWWNVDSVIVCFMVYHLFKVCPALIYMQHSRMVYGEFHRHHYLVLNQNANDKAYSTPLRHEVWNVDNKMLMLVIVLCYNTFSNICVKHQQYPEHDTLCMSIFFHRQFFCIYFYQWHHFW